MFPQRLEDNREQELRGKLETGRREEEFRERAAEQKRDRKRENRKDRKEEEK